MDSEPAPSADQSPRQARRERPPRRRGRLHEALHRHPVSGAATKLIVTGIGAVVLGAGVVMLVTPGPGLLGIVVGLAILATEWDWADSLLAHARHRLEEARQAAARVDPRIRRRRALLGLGGVALALAAVAVLVWRWGWPGFVVDGWGWVQSLAGWIPDLPGM